MPIITFTDLTDSKGVYEAPKPASAFIPQWYKDAKPYINGKKEPYNWNAGMPNVGIKRCMPVFDAITAGYILVTHVDIYVEQVNNRQVIKPIDGSAVAEQPIEQLQGHPSFTGLSHGTRLVHPWIVNTPRGYSILVMQAAHRESPFIIYPGIVDTDNYNYPFNTFFRLRNPNFQGIIPAGTPYCQILPFKRENWKSQIGGEKEREKAKKDFQFLLTRFLDKYKKLWWERKSFK